MFIINRLCLFKTVKNTVVVGTDQVMSKRKLYRLNRPETFNVLMLVCEMNKTRDINDLAEGFPRRMTSAEQQSVIIF